MKKVIILFFSSLVFGLTFISCNNDNNDNDSPVVASVEGKWNFSKVSETENGVVTQPEEDYVHEAGCLKDYIELKPGGVYNEAYYSSGCVVDLTTGTWSKSGNIITITQGSDIISAEVVSVSSSMLKVKISDTDAGITTVTTVTFTKA